MRWASSLFILQRRKVSYLVSARNQAVVHIRLKCLNGSRIILWLFKMRFCKKTHKHGAFFFHTHVNTQSDSAVRMTFMIYLSDKWCAQLKSISKPVVFRIHYRGQSRFNSSSDEREEIAQLKLLLNCVRLLLR